MTRLRKFASAAVLPGLLAAAAALRFHDLGGASLWYDEVVTLTLARTGGPAELLRRLPEIDATAAPLHPLLLQGWLKVLGESDAAGRSFSALCGLLTVGLVYRLGRRLSGGPAAAGWAGALAATSPLLVYYSREARMYAWLVLATCVAWDALLSFAERPRRASTVYVLSLVALGYSHPLGLLMDATLAGTSLAVRRSLGLSAGRWLSVHLAAGAFLVPWLPRYLDHPPEYTVGRLPLKFLLGTPIGFVGGNFLTLGLFAAVIGRGLSLRSAGVDERPPAAWAFCLLAWLLLPPTVLYAYSRVGHPIFGPNRYTLFVGPAFLILVGRGLARLPAWLRWPAGVGAVALGVSTLPGFVYAPGLKADWRAAAAALNATDPGRADPVAVAGSDPAAPRNLEIVTAAYYLGPDRPVVALPADPSALAGLLPQGARRVWVAQGVRGGQPPPELPGGLGPASSTVEVPGLRLFEVPLPVGGR